MSVLTTAEEIINGQRAKDYGDAKENHIRIATLWKAYTGVEFTPEDVAVMMILLKIARFMENGYHQDTVVDIAGYAGVLEKMQLPKSERYPVDPEAVKAAYRPDEGITQEQVAEMFGITQPRVSQIVTDYYGRKQ
ncbi:hypothetical protein SEA_LOKK_54 [Mycobacterium phage Lokk]|nr:hypothetical protein SEA_LOKK_54 [Mycobacterium phage Lokk]QDF18451.1 hypothetical protein SEA_RACHALY_56 [Mycobacterium Phage Rachaly]QGH78748.1 hypothetical protein SEA_MIKO_54 [Mycobacterium phage Miko]